MYIRVAIRAVLADVRKDRPKVALGAVDLLVHAAQRESRAFVIEFRNGADRGPTRIRVTVFARNGKGSMRTSARLSLCGHRADECEHKDKNRKQRVDLEYPENIVLPLML